MVLRSQPSVYMSVKGQVGWGQDLADISSLDIQMAAYRYSIYLGNVVRIKVEE